MKLDDLLKLDRVAKNAGTRNPEGIMESMGYRFIDPGESVEGYLLRWKKSTYYGVRRSLTGKKRDFAIMHEATHGICRHLDLPGFVTAAGAHLDRDSFGSYKLVAGTERDANIGSADFIIDTASILDMLGYEKADVAAYRTSLESFEKAVSDYQAQLSIVKSNGSPKSRILRMMDYSEELNRMYGKLQEQAQDIMHSGLCLSLTEIAKEFGVPESIIAYKIEALAIRNYDVSIIELPDFHKVFSQWNPTSEQSITC